MTVPEKFPRDFFRIFLNSSFNTSEIDEETLRASRRPVLNNEAMRHSFLATFKEILLEEPHSYLEKSRFWAGDFADTDADAEAFFRSTWEMFSKGEQPFPLD